MTTYRVLSVNEAVVSGTAVDGQSIDMEAVDVQLLIKSEDLSYLLANYDPSSGTSPSVTIVREMARAVLDAIIASGVS